MQADCVIENATLAGRQGSWAIAVNNDTIVDVTSSSIPEAREIVDAQGKLVVPGLVDAHIHLDKAFLLGRSPAQTGNFVEALRETLRLKKKYTVKDIQTRASAVLEQAIAFGITAMRSHVEVDPILGLTSMEALL
ncbi:MAG: amidohydrolase family protein, partial [Cyanobacteria bacterium P01_F01_bin.86]